MRQARGVPTPADTLAAHLLVWSHGLRLPRQPAPHTLAPVLLQTMKRRDLLVAQPSNCRGDDSDNPYWWVGRAAH